jgi:hypothetical protein
MYDYKQRETTDEYRENWERLFGLKSGETHFFNKEAWGRKFGRVTSTSVERQPTRFACPELEADDAVRKQSTTGLLQREQVEVGEAGRGRAGVEQREQGHETA